MNKINLLCRICDFDCPPVSIQIRTGRRARWSAPNSSRLAQTRINPARPGPCRAPRLRLVPSQFRLYRLGSARPARIRFPKQAKFSYSVARHPTSSRSGLSAGLYHSHRPPPQSYSRQSVQSVTAVPTPASRFGPVGARGRARLPAFPDPVSRCKPPSESAVTPLLPRSVDASHHPSRPLSGRSMLNWVIWPTRNANLQSGNCDCAVTFLWLIVTSRDLP